MEESNISFASNVNIITSDPNVMSRGDKSFFSKITDYYALKKMYYSVCNGQFNSNKYVWPRWQVNILCGETGFTLKREDQEVLTTNREMDLEYGYQNYDPESLFPLVDEMYLE